MKNEMRCYRGLTTGRRQVIGMVAGLVVLIVAVSLRTQAQEARRVDLKTDEIWQGRVRLIGTLGTPIGEVVKLRGHWQEPVDLSKTGGLQFFVTAVNGTKLKETIVFDSFFVDAEDMKRQRVSAKVNEAWEMIAYEGMQWRNSEGVRQAAGFAPAQNPYEGFRTFLYGVVVSVASTVQQPAKPGSR